MQPKLEGNDVAKYGCTGGTCHHRMAKVTLNEKERNEEGERKGNVKED